MDFKEKYLKYKEKYNKLKSVFNIKGGTNLIIKINDASLKELLIKKGMTVVDDNLYLDKEDFNTIAELIQFLSLDGYRIKSNQGIEYNLTNYLNLTLPNEDLLFEIIKTKNTRTSGIVVKMDHPAITPKYECELPEDCPNDEGLVYNPFGTQHVHAASAKCTGSACKDLYMPKGIVFDSPEHQKLWGVSAERINLDLPVSISHVNTTGKYKIDSSNNIVYLIKRDGKSEIPIEINVIFDTGNHSHSLISENYVKIYNFERKPVMASMKNISKFNKLVDITKHSFEISENIELIKLIRICLDYIDPILSKLSRSYHVKSGEDQGHLEYILSSVIKFGELKIPLIIAIFLKLEISQGVSGHKIISSEYTTIDINIPTIDHPEEVLQTKLKFTLTAYITENESIDLLVSDEVIQNLEILGYNSSGHLKSIIKNKREIKELEEKIEIYDMEMESDPYSHYTYQANRDRDFKQLQILKNRRVPAEPI